MNASTPMISASPRVDAPLSGSASKWRQAVEDAELKIADHQKQIRRLRRAIAVFEENARSNEPWSGESAPDEAQPERRDTA